MSFYKRMNKLAKRQVEKYGATETLLKPGAEPGIDPVTGTPTSGSPSVEIKGSCVLSDFDASEIDGSAVIAGDAKALFYTQSSIVPKIGMLANTADGQYRVQNFAKIAPAGILIAYKLHLRR